MLAFFRKTLGPIKLHTRYLFLRCNKQGWGGTYKTPDEGHTPKITSDAVPYLQIWFDVAC